jgi:3-hydroxymyristoyl/3-hydroxydecanoyl-(acyl carrier protein) dehydratase
MTAEHRIDIPEIHPCYAGHFPGQAILPGVLLLERVMAFAQSQLASPLNNFSLVNVKFLAPVLPGAKLCVSLTSTQATEHKFTVQLLGEGGAADSLACSGQLRILADDATL